MELPMRVCKKRLALLWLSMSALLFFVVLGQSLFGKYGDATEPVWNWMLPTVMPTLSLIVSVLVMDGAAAKANPVPADLFLFRLAFGLSLAYLVAVLAIILLEPLSQRPAMALMTESNIWLGPFQGLVAAALGAFFVKPPEKEKKAE